MITIHIVTVLIAAIAAFVVGFLMHGPIAGKLWMKLANIHPTGKEKFKDMIPQMLWNLLVNVVSALALSVLYGIASIVGFSGIGGGIFCALLVWIGFMVSNSSMEVIWMGRSMKLWLFEVVSSGIVMVVMGIIIATH